MENKNTKLFIPLLLGTDRSESRSEKVAAWVLGKMKARAEIETALFRAADADRAGVIPGYAEAMARADGIVVVSPEYNHSFPGILKTILDTILQEYRRKAAGIVSVSVGTVGGARAAEHLSLVCRELGLVPIKKGLYFPFAGDAFGETGDPKDIGYTERSEKFFDELAWMARALKWGRENLSK